MPSTFVALKMISHFNSDARMAAAESAVKKGLTVLAVAHERLAGEFEQDAGVANGGGHVAPLYQKFAARCGERRAGCSRHPPAAFRLAYFMYDATSAAKSSFFFSMPSPSL